MDMLGFREKLAKRQEAIKSLGCVGLDPVVEKLPPCLKTGSSHDQIATDVARWMTEIVDATAPYASVFKPQKAYYEALLYGGRVLRDVVRHIRTNHPEILVFLDCKRGDIGRTQEYYRIAHFEIDEVHGMNFAPYMGKDCMEFLVDQDHLERAIVGLCYTSNPSGRQPQDARMHDGEPYWLHMAKWILEWATDLGIVENAGLVMAAAHEKPKGSGHIYSEHLIRCRRAVGDKLWFLIPGVGTQGGFVAETVKAAYRGYGSIAINSSSGITGASQGTDFAPAAGLRAQELALLTHEAI